MLQPSGVPVSKITGIAGWLSDIEEQFLMAQAAMVKDGGIIVELGGEYGRSGATLALAVKGRPITCFTIDLFPRDHHFARNHGGLLNVWRHNILAANVKIEPIIAVSWEADEPLKADLVFVDAGHSYLEVKRDIETWAPRVNLGGVMIFHDYAKNPNCHALHFEVKKAVDEWFYKPTSDDKWQKFDGPDSMVYFKRVNMVLPKPEEITSLGKLEKPEHVIMQPRKRGRKPQGNRS